MDLADKFRLACIGSLADRPLYRALERVETEEWSCEKNTLIFGNPSFRGRYVLVHNPEDAIGYFLSKKLTQFGDNMSEKVWEKLFEPYAKRLPEFDVTKCLEFTGWNAWDYYQLVSACASSKLRRPYTTDQNIRVFEGWLLENIGEAIFFTQPHLIPRKFSKHDAVYQHLNDPARTFSCDLMMNFVTLPQGYPTPWAKPLEPEVF